MKEEIEFQICWECEKHDEHWNGTVPVDHSKGTGETKCENCGQRYMYYLNYDIEGREGYELEKIISSNTTAKEIE